MGSAGEESSLSENSEMIRIDGNQKSGSGTIVRDAVGLAALTGQAIHIINIRALRKKPGLRPQHLTALKAVAELCSGRLEGAAVGASEIFFKPGERIKSGEFRWDIVTAGSATMFAMTVIPVALFARGPSVYHIKGGLFQDFAPTALFMKHVFIPALQTMGADIELIIHKPGYVPEGGGHIELRIKPVRELHGLRRERGGDIIRTSGIALSSRLKKRKVSERMADASCKILKRAGFDPEIDVVYDEEGSPAFDEAAVQPGAGFFLRAETDTGCLFGADMAGAPRRAAELIGKRTARSLLEDFRSGATVDIHSADQIIPYAALASGESVFHVPKISGHLDSRLWIAELLLGCSSPIEGRKVVIKGTAFKRS
jgi:RNA 3'-terminal phosphate cyclase (ATP)